MIRETRRRMRLEPISHNVRYFRKLRGMTQAELAKAAGTTQYTVSEIELAHREPHPATLRKLAAALGVRVADFYGELDSPLGPAPSSQAKLFNNGVLDEERRAAWEAAADEARRLRETGPAQMWRVLSGWRASKERDEPYATRRKYLDEIGNLLREVYDAKEEVGRAYSQAAIKENSAAPLPAYLQEEARMTTEVYGELLGLVKGVGLSILSGDDATAARRAAETGPRAKPHSVKEPEVA